MGQQYGAAQPIADVAINARNWITNKLGNPSAPRESKPDTSWHDSMVRKANESFRESAAKRTKSQPPKATSRKKARSSGR